MNTATNLPNFPLAPMTASPPPTGYSIGTVLQGNNPLIGNLWIITINNSFQASLLFDGRRKLVCPDILYKQDKMSPGMRIASMHEIAQTVGPVPMWAKDLMFNRPTRLLPGLTLPPEIIDEVNRQLGLYCRSGEPKATAPTNTCKHEYKQYFGFTDNYDYCIHCDDKKRMPQ